MSFGRFLIALAPLALLVLVVFFVLQQLHMSVGSLIDWMVGVLVLWWLAVVTTLPWNTYFTARDLVEEAAISRQKGIEVAEDAVAFAQRIAKRFLLLAIGLHILSAIGLYLLARFQLVALGYAAAIAALGLTLLRPAQRGYEYLVMRLSVLRQQIHYPREDVMELRGRVTQLENEVSALRTMLDQTEENSWASTQEMRLGNLMEQQERFEDELLADREQNTRDHEQLARQVQTEIAALSEDARFLKQVRELIRFVRSA